MRHYPSRYPIDDDLLWLRRPGTDEELALNAILTESMTELDIQTAMYWRHRCATMVIPNYTAPAWFECDVLVISRSMYGHEYEVKMSRSDYRADFRKELKHGILCGDVESRGWRPKHMTYVVPRLLISPRDIPRYAGLIYARWLSPEHTDVVIFETVKNPPTIASMKFPEDALRRARRNMYYRFWKERCARSDILQKMRHNGEPSNGSTHHQGD